jgi:hypothetical protein
LVSKIALKAQQTTILGTYINKFQLCGVAPPLPHIDDAAFNSYLNSTIERQISTSFLLVDLILG